MLVNVDTVIVFGGGAKGAGRRVQMLDLKSRTWSELPAMPVAYKRNAACAVVRNATTGKHLVVIAAMQSVTSILDLSSMRWRKGNPAATRASHKGIEIDVHG